ncbi:MAG TPA: TetR/AcrR family transcriptional regulator [Gammaproteobacteria bacterium]|nr:TetR/AcrR family transcriptional regulator [Gammaproteobacteria bacterium]
MPRKALTQPRKTASQARSRLTVDALLEATARILVKEGYDRASTNKIAARAGVSIGSLYQYFPSKEALVAAVAERHAERAMGLARRTFARVATSPVETAIRELVTLSVEAHRIDPELHRVLAEQVPRTGRLENVEALTREAHGLLRRYLEAHRNELAIEDLDVAAFICVTTVESLTHDAVLDHPELLTGRKAQRLVDDITRLVARYLKT